MERRLEREIGLEAVGDQREMADIERDGDLAVPRPLPS
jgi:hypothetical protein